MPAAGMPIELELVLVPVLAGDVDVCEESAVVLEQDMFDGILKP